MWEEPYLLLDDCLLYIGLVWLMKGTYMLVYLSSWSSSLFIKHIRILFYPDDPKGSIVVFKHGDISKYITQYVCMYRCKHAQWI